jgi:hypothetical protein
MDGVHHQEHDEHEGWRRVSVLMFGLVIHEWNQRGDASRSAGSALFTVHGRDWLFLIGAGLFRPLEIQTRPLMP